MSTLFPPIDATRDGYRVSTDDARLDLAAVHAFLTASYWARGIPMATVQASVRGSLCFGLYDPAGAQVGFARVVTDGATFAYLCDVYVLDDQRGRGLGKWLMQVVMAHPGVAGVRRFSLATRDAHGLYSAYGFAPIAHPERLMEILRPDIYLQPNPDPTP